MLIDTDQRTPAWAKCEFTIINYELILLEQRIVYSEWSTCCRIAKNFWLAALAQHHIVVLGLNVNSHLAVAPLTPPLVTVPSSQ